MKNGLSKQMLATRSGSSNNDNELTLEQRFANNAHEAKAAKRDMTRHAFLAKKRITKKDLRIVEI
jgi:hypothetical protein